MIDSQNPPQHAVCLAVDLGWRLAELYDSKSLPGPSEHPAPKPLPPHLPGFGEMTPHEKASALVARVGADLASLGAVLGVELPTMAAVQAALGVSGHRGDEARRAVYDLYLAVRDQLAGSDPAAALGFGLGRMLADTVLVPTCHNPQVVGELLGKYRLANAFDWLADLDAALPAHAVAAVRASLESWEEWVSSRRRADGTVDTAQIDESTVRALRRQGETWRRLLTGEQAAAQLLDGRAYVGAAANLLANARRLAFHYAWKWLWAIVLAVAAVAAAVWAAVMCAPAGTARVAAVLVSAAGFLGVSWTGVRATLGRAMRQAEGAMWDAEVVAAIGRAATILPRQRDDRPEPPERDEPGENGERTAEAAESKMADRARAAEAEPAQ